MKQYVPISCDFHSHLESWSVKNELVKITYQNNDKNILTEGQITDLFTKNGEEFLVLNRDLHIRLDQLISVNDLKLQEFQSCNT